MSLKSVQKFINQIPWLPKDIKVILTKTSTEYKPITINGTAKYDEKLYNRLGDVIYGAIYYDKWLNENSLANDKVLKKLWNNKKDSVYNKKKYSSIYKSLNKENKIIANEMNSWRNNISKRLNGGIK